MSHVEPGDFVTIRGNELTWYVESIRDGIALLTSGQTGRRRFEPLANLVKFVRS